MNPFTFGNPIKDPARFIGREADIRQITNRLLSSAHESTSIIGERRIGKTSLLKHLANQDVAKEYGLSPDKYCLVYVDFQGRSDITPYRFWQYVLKTMSTSISDEIILSEIKTLLAQDEFDLFDLEDVFRTVVNQGMTTVLFLDEFEEVTTNPNFTGDFFGGLRVLAIHHDVALIPATSCELVDLCHSEEIKGSPFFNIFANVILRPFNLEEVDEMVCKYLKDAEFTCSPEEKDLIWNLSGGYPHFTQIAGYYLIDGKDQKLNNESLFAYTQTQFDQQADAHFKYLWSHSSEDEKITLLIILMLGLQKPSKKSIPNLENLSRVRARSHQDLNSLSKRGLVHESNGKYSVLSSSFESWVRQEVVAIHGKEETASSVDEWLKSENKGNLKDAKGILPGFKKQYWHILGDLAKDLSMEFAVTGSFELIKLLMIAG